MGFAAYWRWKGRPRIGKEVRDLIRRMSFGRFDREVVLYGFDLFELNGDDLRSLPLEQRNASSPSSWRQSVELSEHVEAGGAIVFLHACKLGCEGHRLEAT